MNRILKTTISAAAIAGFTAITGFAYLNPPRDLSLSKESKLWIEGTSTVRSFKCTAGNLDADVSAKSAAAPAAELVNSASLSVPVASLDCKNSTMNDHMRKALKAKDNPQIAWKMTSYTVDGTAVVLSGKLTIAGKENPIELRGTGTVDNGIVRFKGSKQFKMTEFGVKPPSLMLGTMKVRDPVTVSFDLVLNP